MKFINPLDLRVRLVLLLLFVFSILFLIPVWNYGHELDTGLKSAKANMVEKIKLLAEHQAYLLHRGENIMNSLANKPELSPQASVKVCQQYLATKLAQNPEFVQMATVQPNGDITCAGVPPGEKFNLGERAYFQRALKSSGILISEVVNGKIINKPVIIFSKPVRDQNNVVTSVILLALGLNWLKTEIANRNLPEGARISVIDSRGDVIIRHPDPELWTGKNAALAPAVQQILMGSPDGVFEDVSMDGTSKLFAYAPLFGTDLGVQYHLLLSIPKQVIEAPIRHEALLALGVMVTVLGLTIVMVMLGGNYLLIRPLQQLAKTATHMKLGDLSSRTGLPHGSDALGRLAENLDQSADAIEERDHQLRANKARYRTLVEMSPDPVIVQHARRIVYVNPAAVTFFLAASEADLIGQSVLDFISPQYHKMALTRFNEIAKSNGFAPLVRQQLIKLDRSLVEVTVQSVSIMFNDAPAIQIHIYDQTERLRREQELEHLREEMQSMMEWQVARHTVAALAHEINQPLASIAALSEATRRMLMDDGLTMSSNSQHLKQLVEALVHMGLESERAGHVLRNLMHTVHQPKATLVPIELSELLSDVRSDFLLFHGVDCEIILSCEANLPPILMNRIQITKVLLNLLTNSAQAMQSAAVLKGRIWVDAELSTDGKQVQLGVQDQGPGIAPEVRHQIFQPFVSTKPDGLGMGLTISRTLIELHGGTLWCENQTPSGSLFLLTLPISKENA
jgi:PAS domain S-box-containing protein